jgi:hypothetical protein
MPEHRNLSVENFINAVDPALLEQYFVRLLQGAEISCDLGGMDPERVFLLLDEADEPVKAIILEDFRRINDICERDLGLPFTVAHRFGVTVQADQKPQTIALKLFLDHPRAFNLAWALYSYQASWSNISQHWLQKSEVRLDTEAINRFSDEMEKFFIYRNQGDECQTSFYDECQRLVILVLHGTHIRTVTCWQGRKLAMNSFRPACEDVLIYDKDRAVLSVKASGRVDREHHIRSFARLILEDSSVGDDPRRDLIYTLEPLRETGFVWSSTRNIGAVELIEAKLRLSQPGLPTMTIQGAGIDLSQGEVLAAKLRFTISENGRQSTVIFTLWPPCVTDLVKKRQADIICPYLRQKGILLR